jgi:putative transposase
VGEAEEQRSRSTSKSALSRRFVAAPRTALTELMGADLSGLDLGALMVDGFVLARHTVVVALGIDMDGAPSRPRRGRHRERHAQRVRSSAYIP